MEKIEDPVFQLFWNEFRSAVLDGEKEKTAKLTWFPFARWRECLEKTEFYQQYRGIFSTAIVGSIADSPVLVRSNNYPGVYYGLVVHYQDANEGMEEFFEFSKVGRDFKLTRVGHLDTQCPPANKSLKPTNPAQGDR